ncbi:MAG: NAD(P)-dependent oxidoreductase [Gammaproteobacteria bacterium]|nr:NAD(P)-dependent oxidoreductase [Gammaproteobacteria bacterium]
MTTLGFVGTGTIGAPMAGRLLAAGHVLRVLDSNPAACTALVDAGAAVATSPADLAVDCATVFLSLPGPAAIEAIMLGDDGLLARPGALTTVVDLSTNALDLNRRLAEQAASRGVAYLDAPVSGGKAAAAAGKLAVMVGGEDAAFARIRPLLECFAAHVFHLGPAGAGTLAKLVNNQIFLAASVLVQEGFVLGAKAGMDANVLREVLAVSSAGPYLARADLVLSHRYDRDIFALGIAAKDIGLALESAAAVGAELPLTAAAQGIYRRALELGDAREDFHATLRALEDAAQTTVARLQSKPR